MSQEFRQKYGIGVLEQYIKDKENYQLQTGIDPTSLGLEFQQKNLIQKFISPFAESMKVADPLNQQYMQTQAKDVQNKKEFIQKFPEETHFYIFYNQMDEQQQMWAVECLYNKGWRYHYQNETWFKELIPKGNNIYSCKIFSIQKWAIVDVPQIQLDLEKDFYTQEDFEESLKL